MKKQLGVLSVFIGSVAIGLVSSPLEAGCTANSGAWGPPETLWGSLRPTEPNGVDATRDSTEFDGGQAVDYRHPLFSSVDVEGNIAFTSYTFGFHVWDLSGTNRETPVLLATRDQGRGEFLSNIGYQELRWLFWDVDAPSGRSDVVAIVGIKPFGMVAADTSDPSNPRIAYQDESVSSDQVWSTVIDKRAYAFTAGAGGSQVYDLTAAKAQKGCLEDSGSRHCGVHVATFGSGETVKFIDGFHTGNGQVFVATSSTIPKGIELWEVTDPANPRPVNGGDRIFPDDYVFGVALWEQGGRQYLSSIADDVVRIHEVTGCLGGSSTDCSAPRKVWGDAFAMEGQRRYVTYSESGGAGYLYFGHEDQCSGGLARERLYDLSLLEGTEGPQEISPHHTITLDGIELDYWGWYYSGNYSSTSGSGFNRVMPFAAKVVDGYLYRAAWTLFDVHSLNAIFRDGFEGGDSSGWTGE